MTKRFFPYFKFYPSDWLVGTRGMTLEERGAYIDMICMQMMEQGNVRDDERLIAHQMHVSTRKWRSVRGKLIEHGKISIQDGFVVQERCLKELDLLLTQRQVASESAANRERTKRENLEKSNEINAPDTTKVPLRARDSDIRESEVRKEDSSPSEIPAPAGAAPAEGEPKKPNLVDVVIELEAKRVEEERGFEDFWKLYPLKKGKGAALKIWKRMKLDVRRKAYVALKAQLPSLRAKKHDSRGNYCPHPATWLNQGRWDDEVEDEAVGQNQGGADKPHWKKTEDEKLSSLMDYVDEAY